MDIEITPELLIELRNKKGFTQEQVAINVGVSQRSYSMWERGETKPKHKSLMKLLEVLEVKSEEPKRTTEHLEDFKDKYIRVLEENKILLIENHNLKEELMKFQYKYEGNEEVENKPSAPEKNVKHA